MKYRTLGKSGLSVPVLSLGTGTFGGTTEFFKRWGQTDVKQAARLIDVSLERGLNFFDTANVYSQGCSNNADCAHLGSGWVCSPFGNQCLQPC